MHNVTLKHMDATILTFLLRHVFLGGNSLFWRCQEDLVLGFKVLSLR